MKEVYFVIPTVNGEIIGDPYIVLGVDALNFIKEEVIVYSINPFTLNVYEVKL